MDNNSVFETCGQKLGAAECGRAFFLPSASVAYAMIAHALCGKESNVIVSSGMYGGRTEQLASIFHDTGADVITLDTCHPCHVEQSVDDNTRAIIVESISAPDMAVSPLEALARIARRHNLLLIVDNTAATHLRCTPIKWGAHIVIHSTLAYITGRGCDDFCAVINGGGQTDCLFDGIFTAAQNIAPFRDAFAHFAPFFCDALDASASNIKTISENTLACAEFMSLRPEVSRVFCASLKAHPHNDMASVYFKNGATGAFSFSLKGGADKCAAFVKAMDKIAVGTDENTFRTRITIDSTDEKLCLSLGTEPVDMIIEELKKGIEA